MSVVISLRVDPEIKERFRAAAEQAGLDLTAWMIAAGNAYVPAVDDDEPGEIQGTLRQAWQREDIPANAGQCGDCGNWSEKVRGPRLYCDDCKAKRELKTQARPCAVCKKNDASANGRFCNECWGSRKDTDLMCRKWVNRYTEDAGAVSVPVATLQAAFEEWAITLDLPCKLEVVRGTGIDRGYTKNYSMSRVLKSLNYQVEHKGGAKTSARLKQRS